MLTQTLKFLALGAIGLGLSTQVAKADSFVSELRVFANTCPKDHGSTKWMPASGQSIAIPENRGGVPFAALYSLIGNLYGGKSGHFNLPKLNGTSPPTFGPSPVGAGTNSVAKKRYSVGQNGGSLFYKLKPVNVPHSHDFHASDAPNDTNVAMGNLIGQFNNKVFTSQPPSSDTLAFNSRVIGAAGSDQPKPIELVQPSLTMVWCICVEGHDPRL